MTFATPYPYISSPFQPPAPSSLMAWTQTHFNGLFLAETDEARKAAFASSLSPNIQATVNQVSATVDQILEHVALQRKGVREKNGFTLKWLNCLEVVDKVYEDDQKTGLVGGWVYVSRYYDIANSTKPEVQHAWAALHIKVEQDPAVEADDNSDQRQISVIYETSVDTSMFASTALNDVD
ncbi:hypothetical protein OF83DRAFT_1174389 [Amylostereum chailletii]|nr:hypothetical protein OF83DRAFT_1174389 [Amylostereum chailletii]